MNDLSFHSNHQEPTETTQNSSLAESFANNSSAPPTNDNAYESKGLSIVSILLLVVFLGMTAFGGYQLYQIKSTENQIELTEQALQEARSANIAATERVNVDFRSRFLTQKKEDQLFWSNVITNIETSIPDIRRTNVNSINGSENGNVNISFNTTPQSTSPFNDTADLITAFKTKAFFDNVFIPNISSSVTSAGISQLTYNMRLTYLRQSDETSAVRINAPQSSAPTTPVQEEQLLDPATIQEIVSQQQTQESNEE